MAYPHRMGMQRPVARAPLAGLALLAAVALSACGSQSSTNTEPASPANGDPVSPSPATSTPHTMPAAGPVLKAQGFSFRVPRGWADISDAAADGVLLSAAHPTDDNPSMITVRHGAHAPGTLAAAAKAASRLLAAAGGTHVQTRPATTVGGNQTAHVVATQVKPGSHYQLDAYYVLTGTDGWVITFATDQYTSASRRSQMLLSVLETCRWRTA
jgi:hypothetical protein